MLFKVKTSDACPKNIDEDVLTNIVGEYIMDQVKLKGKMSVPVINRGRTVIFEIETYPKEIS